MAVAVVTDSTAYLPADLASGLTVVPLHVVLGGRSGREGVEVSPAEVAAALNAHRVAVTTSQPTPTEIAVVYRRLLSTGATGIVSVHLSAGLSGTFDTAQQAAEEVGGDIVVVDSRSAGMGVGFPALAAAAVAAKGGSVAEVSQAALATVEQVSTFFYVDTLEHLRRGGRITAASALLGTALAVKPLLEIVDGKVMLRDKVRTSARALDRLVGLAIEAAGDGSADIAVHHLAAPERAEWVADQLRTRLKDQMRTLQVCEVGAVVGAHVGPGLAGVVVHRLP